MTRGELLQQAIGLIDDRHLALALARPSRHRLKLLPLVAAALAMVLMGVFAIGGLLPGRHGVIPPAVTTGDETTSPLEPTGTLEPDTQLFPDGLVANTLKEYQELIATYRMPSRFVTLEDISEYGSFTFFRFDGKLSCGYTLVDSAGNRLSLDIYHEPFIGSDKLPDREARDENMRYINDKSEIWTQVRLGQITYRYFAGELQAIDIRGEYHDITIDAKGGLHACKFSEEAPLSRLLTRSTAEAEAKALLAKIEG